MVLNIIAIVALCVLVSANASAAPGKIFLWSSSSKNKEEKHLTASFQISSIMKHIKETIGKYEAVVILSNTFQSAAKSTLDNVNIKKSMQKAPFKNLISHVYLSEDQKSLKENMQEHLPSETKDIHTMSAVLDDLKTHKMKLSNNKPDIYHVTFDPTHNPTQLNELEDLSKQSEVLFISVDEPHSLTSLPRRLSSSNSTSTTDSTSLYYKPEGAEYSIYYADTFLYITPDIFTGLMTGLFFVFVLHMGIGCLGSIQGMSTFQEKLVSVGREA